MEQDEFKEKARRLVFNIELRNFPVIYEMYVRTFGLDVDLDATMAGIISIIRESENQPTAYTLVCHYLDSLEE